MMARTGGLGWMRRFRTGFLAVCLFGGAEARAQCVGDCNGNGSVTVDELIRGVNIALGSAPIDECGVMDINGDSTVTIDELVRAVNNALNGCPAQPTATSTDTPAPTSTSTDTPAPADTPTATEDTPTATEVPADTPTEVPLETATATATPTEVEPGETPTEEAPTATATETPTPEATATPSETPTDTPPPTSAPTLPPTGAGEEVAGRAAVVANGVNSLANVITGVVVSAGGITRSGGTAPAKAAGGGGGIDFDDCPIAGTTSQDCTAGAGTVTIQLGAQMCVANSPSGGTGTFHGDVSLVGPGSVCPLITGAATFDIALSVVLNNGVTNVLTVGSSLSGTATLGLGGACLVNSVTGTMNGTLTGTLANGSGTEISFNNTSFRYFNPTYNADCVPVVYSFEFNGPATLRELASNETFAVTFTNFVMTQDASTSPASVTYTGTIASDCFGGPVALQTLAPVAVAAGELCPNAGTIQASRDGTARVTYRNDGSVEIDENNDGVTDVTYPSCTDPALLMCGS